MPDGQLVQSISETSRDDPYTEAYRTGLFESVFDLVNQQLGFQRQPTGETDPSTGEPLYNLTPTGQGPIYRPTQQIAGRTGFQNQADALAAENLGGFMPYIQGGLGQVQKGQGVLSEAEQVAAAGRGVPQDILNQARSTLGGGTEQFRPGDYNDPTSNIGEFYNPYEGGVVSAVQRDFDRMRNKENLNQNARAIGSGAFGGTRNAVADREGARNLYEAEGDTLAKIRRSGYNEAMTGASTAHENAQRRALTGGSSLGNLGATYANVNTGDVNNLRNIAGGIGSLGLDEAGLGTQAAGQMRADVGTLGLLGNQQQAHQQSVLDAIRNTNTQRQQLPFEMYSYLGDQLNRNASSSQQILQDTYGGSGPSAGAQATAYGIAALGTLAGVS